MRSTICGIYTMMAVLLSFVVCQATQPTTTEVTPSKVKPAVAQAQWEYLVISFGKTLFISPNEEPETKTMGLSKLISYSKAGIVSAQEALYIQNQMDVLGKFGWELVSIIGSIGGDQQMIFKRLFDEERSVKEAILVRQEGERIIATQKEEALKLANKTKVPATDLIDMDAVDEAAAITEIRQKDETLLKEAIKNTKDYNITSVDVVSSSQNLKNLKVSADITIDGTVVLLKDGNKYRLSEAKALALQFANDTYAEARVFGEIKLIVSVSITCQGISKIVTTEKVMKEWPGKAIKF